MGLAPPTLGPWLRPLIAYQGHSTKTPRYQYACMTEALHMTHLTYVSTRYGLGPSHFRTSLASLPGYFMHSTKKPRCQYTCMTETSHMAHLTYVSTRYGLGPSHFRTVAMSLDSLPGCFMHSIKSPRCVCMCT